MTALAPDALSLMTLDGDAAARPLAAELARYGAALAAAPADDVDLLLISVHDDARLDAAADGTLAANLARAFAAARDGVGRVRPGGGVVLVCTGASGARGAVASLSRSLALEWAGRGIRVNAVGCRHAQDAAELVAFTATAAGRMLTGSVIDVS